MTSKRKILPKQGQESVWDYPRPPACEPSSKHIRIVFNHSEIASSSATFRVLETSHPPVYYIPLTDFKQEVLLPSAHTSFCEWKGRAKYFHLKVEDRKLKNVVWQYPEPTTRFSDIAHCVAVYPGKMDACYINDEKVQSQAGDFYGGWISSDIVGPFKGEPGTWGW